jgi:hypothetical protein
MTNYKIDRGIAIPKTKLHPNPWNPNHMKPRQQTAVEESIKSYGQVLELLVRPHPELEGEYQIIDGEHRFNVLPDTVYCNVIYGLPDAEAKKLTIVMNETRGAADKIELAQLLAELSTELDDLSNALPWDDGELDELVKLADVDWDSFTDAFEEDDQEPTGEDPTDDFVRLSVAVPREAMDIVNQAKDLVKEQEALHKDTALAWGQVLERLAADYIAMPK